MTDASAHAQPSCESEPIHIPASIQPHGMLLVVDIETDRVVQVARSLTEFLGEHGSILGQTLEALIGSRAADLLERDDGNSQLPGVLRLTQHAGLLAVVHRQDACAIVEIERSSCSAPFSSITANIGFALQRIGSAESVSESCRAAAEVVHKITRYNRVMVYRFEPDWSGTVVAEVQNGAFPSLLNHRFPASDIPQRARDLYLRNPIRVIPDVAYVPAPLEPALCPTTGLPLDMTLCVLRSVSPVHIQYLRNMGVGASMSISVIVGETLWGLIACHSSESRQVPYEARELCRLIGQITSQRMTIGDARQNLERALELTRKREAAISVLRDARNPRARLQVAGADFMDMVPSDGIAICSGSKITTAGSTPTAGNIRLLAAWLQSRINPTAAFGTDCISSHLPSASAFAAEASGLLSIVLNVEKPIVLIWFRAEQMREVDWAGNPHHKTTDKSERLTPRKSFEAWKEMVRWRSRPWTSAEIAAAQLFSDRATAVLQRHAIIRLNARLKEKNSELAVQAASDGLTGLANRRVFDKRLRKEWSRAARAGQTLSLITCDLDWFKQFNDARGHPAGDSCLREVARVLKAGRRRSDVPARIGGEEFALLLPNTDLAGAAALAEELRSKVEALAMEHPCSSFGRVTLSLGVANNQMNGCPSEQSFIEAADAALYAAKSRGRNQVVLALTPEVDLEKRSDSAHPAAYAA